MAPEAKRNMTPLLWLIHIGVVCAFAVAIDQALRYARLLHGDRARAFRRIGLAMAPGLLGSLFVLAHHATGADPAWSGLLNVHGALVLLGNCALASAAFRLPRGRPAGPGPGGPGGQNGAGGESSQTGIGTDAGEGARKGPP